MPFFILKDGEPVEADIDTWVRFMLNVDNVLCCDEVRSEKIQTIFFGHWVGRDHEKPLVFETIRHSQGDIVIEGRYSTPKEAIEGHLRITRQIKDSEGFQE